MTASKDRQFSLPSPFEDSLGGGRWHGGLKKSRLTAGPFVLFHLLAGEHIFL